MMSLSGIFSVLSDDDSLRIIQMVANRRNPKITEFESPKRYYTRLLKLKNAFIVKRKGRSYELTAFGSVIYDIIQMVKMANDLHWKLQVIDAIGDKVPDAERQQIIESLIPDSSIRQTLIGTKPDLDPIRIE